MLKALLAVAVWIEDKRLDLPRGRSVAIEGSRGRATSFVYGVSSIPRLRLEDEWLSWDEDGRWVDIG